MSLKCCNSIIAQIIVQKDKKLQQQLILRILCSFFLFKWEGRISGKHTSSGLRGQLMSIVGSVCFVSG